MYENSVQVYNFSTTSEPVASTSSNEQNGLPQVYNPNSQHYNSSFAKCMPKVLDTGLM